MVDIFTTMYIMDIYTAGGVTMLFVLGLFLIWIMFIIGIFSFYIIDDVILNGKLIGKIRKRFGVDE
jgi:hypothetical protein